MNFINELDNLNPTNNSFLTNGTITVGYISEDEFLIEDSEFGVYHGLKANTLQADKILRS